MGSVGVGSGLLTGGAVGVGLLTGGSCKAIECGDGREKVNVRIRS